MDERSMAYKLTCPACAQGPFNLADYESMMVLRSDLALFSLRCPHCKTRISTLQPIPPSLMDAVRRAADRIGAGMGAE